ncbi:MAG: hypothetical protein KDB07_09775, partial [Planctomycetes bacterium]|nr:hypothetical protein [Planctomycetota bacterium]
LDANDAEKLREAKSALSAAISDNESQTLAESTDSALRELAEQVLRESESTLANLAQERAALRALAQRGEVENPRSEAGRVQAGQGKREVGEISTGAAQAVFIARDAWAKPSVRSADERNQSGAIVSRFRDSLRGKARD